MGPQALAAGVRPPQAMNSRSNSNGPAYQSPEPESVRVLPVGELIGDSRAIIPAQQARLGFQAEGMALRVWCVGDVGLLMKRSIAIVGTRDVSVSGAARARRLARELADEGMVVFSGLAKGVDTEALQSAIRAGGRVVA